jgi:hypothetical protein
VSFSALKAQARQAVHETFKVAASYSDAFTPPIGLHVRWHNKLIRPMPNMEGVGYAELIEGVNRIIFAQDELQSLNVLPRSKGRVLLSDYGSIVFVLESREPADGPVDVIWNVSR